jgi:GT2 family glycosyltransferase
MMQDKQLDQSEGVRPSTSSANAPDPRPSISTNTALTSVIILSYNKFAETTGRCLDSLADDPDFPHWDAIVVDNASDEKTRTLLAATAQKHPSLRIILSEANRGFAGGMNLGMRQARGDVFILLNSDTVVPKGIIGRIADAVRSNPRAGLLGPVTNAAGNEQGIFTSGVDAREALEEGLAFANAQAGTRAVPAYRLDFCCVALSRDAYEKVGELDEAFGRGYYEDFDYSLRARQAGLELGVLEGAFVYHQGSVSFKALGRDTRDLIARNKALLLKKHGGRVGFPHSRDANLEVLRHYALMSARGDPPPRIRILNRLALARANQPKSWWKRWRYRRRLAEVERSLQPLLAGTTASGAP